MLDLSGKNKREYLAVVWSGAAVTGPQRIPQQSKRRRPWGRWPRALPVNAGKRMAAMQGPASLRIAAFGKSKNLLGANIDGRSQAR
jgi:hypothetical protein